MRISNEQLQKVADSGGSITPDSALVDAAVIKLTDKALIEEITHKVADMPDRDDLVAELKARVEAGDYNPTGEEIADAMVRRAIADQVR
ncbi:MAG: flagellar biosynthesis anti-sigma factor FlgM [Fimbriimonadaceae bacterium]